MGVGRNSRERIKRFLPSSVVRIVQRRLAEFRAAKDVKDVFGKIYSSNVWGGEKGELFSGPGSRGLHADRYVDTITRFIQENDVITVVDIGCGDFHIGKQIAASCPLYIGVDAAEPVIAQNRVQFGSPSVSFRHLDAATDDLPKGDLCLIRQVLQHLSNAEILQILEKCRMYNYLIITEHYTNEIEFRNLDIAHGSDTRATYKSAIFLDYPPFDLNISDELLEVPLPHPDGRIIHPNGVGVLKSFLIVNPSLPA